MHDRNQDWRGAVRLVNSSEIAPDRVVFVRSGFVEADRLRCKPSRLLTDFCLAPVTSIYLVDTRQRQLIPLPTTMPGRLDDSAVDIMRQQGGACFLFNGSRRSKERFVDRLTTTLQDRQLAAQPPVERSFGEVHVIEIECR